MEPVKLSGRGMVGICRERGDLEYRRSSDTQYIDVDNSATCGWSIWTGWEHAHAQCAPAMAVDVGNEMTLSHQIPKRGNHHPSCFLSTTPGKAGIVYRIFNITHKSSDVQTAMEPDLRQLQLRVELEASYQRAAWS